MVYIGQWVGAERVAVDEPSNEEERLAAYRLCEFFLNDSSR